MSVKQFGWIRATAGSGLMRLATMPVSLVCGLLSVHVMISHVGPADYGLISLLFGIQFLLPFMDLGTSAGVLEGAARFTVSGRIKDLSAPLRTALKVTSMMSFITLGCVGIVALRGWWPALIGRPDDVRLTSAMVLIFAVNLFCRPLNLVLASLIGLGRATSVVVLQILVPTTGLAVVVVASRTSGGLALFAASLVLGQLVCGLAAAVLLAGAVPGIVDAVMRSPLDEGGDEGLSVRRFAGPMLVINLVAPLSMALDRLVLSHRSDEAQLAAYALAAQIFLSAGSFAATVQPALWAEFSARRARRDPGLALFVQRVSLAMLLAGLVGGVVLWLVSPALAHWVSASEIALTSSLLTSFALTFVFQMALAGPSAALTTPRGLRQQAVILVVTVCLNLLITVVLAPRLGAVAPALGSAVGTFMQWMLTFGLYRYGARTAQVVDHGVVSTP